MFTHRSALVLAVGLLACAGCDPSDSTTETLTVEVIAADTVVPGTSLDVGEPVATFDASSSSSDLSTGTSKLIALPVATATVIVESEDDETTQTTDATGVTEFSSTKAKLEIVRKIIVEAPGYKRIVLKHHQLKEALFGKKKEALGKKKQSKFTLQIAMKRSAPAIVFHTFKGSVSTQTAQVADVQVSQGGTVIFSGTTTTVAGISTYAGLIVPDLSASTTYSYSVSAQGFRPVSGTVTTNADATAVEVDVLLVPVISVNGGNNGGTTTKPLP